MEELERIEQLPVSDWTDQDLLTKDEARARLIEEISRAQARLDQLQPDNPEHEPEIALLSKRLTAMQSVRGEYDTYLDGS
ncbi:MAG: hypothetical protein JWR37_1195 [Mycobacterium sp.]|nr:hypothetical protein [Mycobacterium sp.]